jgi:hypothetical protein
MRWCSLAARALYWALGIKQASGNSMFRGPAIIANVLVSDLALEYPKGRMKFLQVGVAPDGEAGDFPRRSIFGRHRRSFKNKLSDDQGNLWKRCHLQKAYSKRRTELKE